MKISGAFLAEKTEAADNKLNVRGGVISRYNVGSDRLAQFEMVVLTQADSGDADRRVVIEISAPNGEETPLRMERELPDSLTNADMGFACFGFRLTLNFNGRWIVALTGAGDTVSLPLTVNGPPPRNSL